jgi:hypothetical protein
MSVIGTEQSGWFLEEMALEASRTRNIHQHSKMIVSGCADENRDSGVGGAGGSWWKEK